MALAKSKKKEILEKVSDVAEKAESVVFVNFHGLTVSDSTEMRKTLRGAGVNYTVAKKSLAKRAFADRKIAGTMPELEGELAIAYGSDMITPAREVYVFQKKYDGKITILGGVFENAYKNKEEMTVIAEIPSQKVLYGMFLNIINSPIQRFVIAMNEIAKTKTE